MTDKVSPTLAVNNLRLSFSGLRGKTEVLHGISLRVNAGECTALVGESGSGKSVTARAILGLLRETRAARISGSIEFEGRDLSQLPEREYRALRGARMSMIFQDPTSSLNPVYTVGTQFHEVLKRGKPDASRAESDRRAAKILKEVFIRDAERVLSSYSFQLSGGMNQRVMIAMAMLNDPSLLIADEPGTALDVTVQARTLSLMRTLTREHGTAVLFISHNLGVVADFADRVSVICRGRIVEEGAVSSVFGDPRHAYTRALLAAVPRITDGGDIQNTTTTDFTPEDFAAPAVSRDKEAR